jgi:hypothetical protein
MLGDVPLLVGVFFGKNQRRFFVAQMRVLSVLEGHA